MRVYSVVCYADGTREIGCYLDTMEAAWRDLACRAIQATQRILRAEIRITGEDRVIVVVYGPAVV